MHDEIFVIGLFKNLYINGKLLLMFHHRFLSTCVLYPVIIIACIGCNSATNDLRSPREGASPINPFGSSNQTPYNSPQSSSGNPIPGTPSANGQAGAAGSAVLAGMPGEDSWIVPDSKVARTALPQTADYYVASDGNDSNPGTKESPWKTIQKGVNAGAAGKTIFIRQGTYKERITFKAANSGSTDKYLILAAQPGEQVVLDGSGIGLGQLDGLINITGAHNVRISGFRIENAGSGQSQMGVFVQNAKHIVVDNVYTKNTASAGIGSWYSNYVVISGNQIEKARTTGEQECLSLNETIDFEVSYNKVWDSKRCEGIDAKNGSGRGHIFKNEVHDIYIEGIYIDAYEAHTYDLDVYSNVIYGCGLGITITSEQGGLLENIRVFNNIVHDTTDTGIAVLNWDGMAGSGGPVKNVSLFNNTIVNVGNTTPPDGGFRINYAAGKLTGLTIRNNIIVARTAAIAYKTPAQNVTVDHNLISGTKLVSGQGGLTDANLVQGDPKFTNQASKDYHLSAGSPAIDKGSTDIPFAFDFDGIARPQGGGFDIGAYEFRN